MVSIRLTVVNTLGHDQRKGIRMTSQLKAKALAGTLLAILVIGIGSGTASAKVAEFASAAYPATLTGTQTVGHVIATKAGKIKCSTVSFSGPLSGQQPTLAAAPTYGGCSLGGIAVGVTLNNCEYSFLAGLITEPNESLGFFRVECAPKNEIVFLESKSGCEIRIPKQELLSPVEFKTAGGGTDFDVILDVEFKYTLNGKCGVAAGTYEDGLYTGQLTYKGNKGAVGIE